MKVIKATLPILLFLSSAALSEGVQQTKTLDKFISLDCLEENIPDSELYTSKYFKEYDKQASNLMLKACRYFLTDISEIPIVDDYWSKDEQDILSNLSYLSLVNSFNSAQTNELNSLNSQIEDWEDFNGFGNKKFPRLAKFEERSVSGGYGEKNWFLSAPRHIERPKEARFGLGNDSNQYCKSVFNGADDCAEVFRDFNVISNKVSAVQRNETVKEHLKFVKSNNKAWDVFDNDSRFQTPFDILATAFVFRDHMRQSKRIVTPPPYQVFALRPSLVYEHIESLPAGERDDFSLAMEWAGINAWDWSMPLGVSIASVYTDREGVDSIGHGLMFHINNSFTVGYVDRDQGSSIFFNIEFNQWWGETETKGSNKKYKSALNKTDDFFSVFE